MSDNLKLLDSDTVPLYTHACSYTHNALYTHIHADTQTMHLYTCMHADTHRQCTYTHACIRHTLRKCGDMGTASVSHRETWGTLG